MAPGNNERHSGHTGTIPKTKVRNNCNVPQEAVTPTRRDMTTNLVSTSLDWVPVSEYNSRTNYSQTRKPSNNTSDQELTDLDNSVSFESGFGRFVPVRPQPRALPLNVQNRDNIGSEQQEDGTGSTISSHTLHPYAHQMQNGLIPHSNHAAAAVMIVNPTTPNALTGNISQPFNTSNQNRNNLSRNLNSARNNFDGNSHSSTNNSTPPISNSRSGTKAINLMNNMYEQGQGSFNNVNDSNHAHRESARALGEAIVAACPDAAAVERRLGQIREYIRVTSSLVDTMRNSEDEAFIEHTKEEYDELVEMVMKLKESEENLEKMLIEKRPDNIEVPAEEIDGPFVVAQASNGGLKTKHEDSSDSNLNQDKTFNVNNNLDNSLFNNNLKKVTNIENEQLNKSMHSVFIEEETPTQENKISDNENTQEQITDIIEITDITNENNNSEVSNVDRSCKESEVKNDDQELNELLRRNILSCVKKVALIEEIKNKNKDNHKQDDQDIITRPVSAQSNGSAYSDNELWQNEIKNKMELSQMRLAALKQQQKRLLKYQEEAKQQLEEINRERQSQDVQPSTSHDNFSVMQNQPFSGNYHHANRMYAANQIGVATTLPHSSDTLHGQHSMTNNVDHDHGHSAHSTISQDEQFSQRDNHIASSEEAAGGGHSEPEDDEMLLNERGQMLQIKLRELHMKKQHMENLVSEFQKLQMATRLPTTRNTYSTSGEDSAEDEPTQKCVKSGNNNKNEDPFKLMEIKAIKTALQKTKDLMRSVENYEVEHLSSGHETSYRDMSGPSNIHDNKSEGGGSMSGWSNEGSMCRLRNTLSQRHKFTNEQQHLPQQQHTQHHPQQLTQHHPQQQLTQHHSQQQHTHHHPQQQHTQHHPQQQLAQLHPQQQIQQQQLQQQQSHEANIASLQELAQELRMETEKIIGERTRIKDMISNKEVSRKQKKVNVEVLVGPAERRQMQLRALLQDKQRELDALLNKEKDLCSGTEAQKVKPESRTGSIVNQSGNSEQEEHNPRSDQTLLDSQNSRDTEDFRGGGDSMLSGRAMAAVPAQLDNTYGSDSDSMTRNKSNQRNRSRRRQLQERQTDDSNGSQSNITNQSIRNEPRSETSNVNMAQGMSHNSDNPMNVPYMHLPPPCWNTKSNQDVRTNQFTQNSHSQTMERLLGTPQMSFPPSMPFNMMMPYGMVGNCGCGCGFWGAWCWQQLVMHQREIHQLREQLNHLEERWRAETASHTLNNQVPPGNRANNYWDNFRSYSRQNLLSTNNKANADGHLSVGPTHNPHPLVERSHNTLHHPAPAASPCATPKRNTNTISCSQNAAHSSQSNNDEPLNRLPRRNVTYERSLSFSSAPDVLNVNQNPDTEVSTSVNSRNPEDTSVTVVPNVNLNRQESTPISFRNLNITNPIPEIIQSHSNNLNTPANSKKKSSSKLPAKNSTNRRNYTLDYSQTSNINIASTSQMPNPNLASTSRVVEDKATSKLFDLLRENIYSEVTTLIGVNESHPDFLIQLFRDLQLISSDTLRQKVLQSIRNVLSQYNSIMQSQANESVHEDIMPEAVSTTSAEMNNHIECNSHSMQNICTSTMQIDSKIVRFLMLKSEETCTQEFLEALASLIISTIDGRYSQQIKRRLLEMLSKYDGMRVCDVSSDIIENLTLFVTTKSDADSGSYTNELSESTILQDVAGSLNLFSSSDTQLHQINACPYDIWPGHVHVDIDSTDINDNGHRSTQEVKVDLINCSEMHNGDLAEADQTCHTEIEDAGDGGEGGGGGGSGRNGRNVHDEAGANAESLPDVVDTEEVTPTEAEAEWLGLDRVPTRLHMEESSEKQKDKN